MGYLELDVYNKQAGTKAKVGSRGFDAMTLWNFGVSVAL